MGGKEISSSPREGRGQVRAGARKTQEHHKDASPQTPPAGSTLTESKEDFVFLPLQVELVHPEQGLKLLPADVVQDLLGWGHRGWRCSLEPETEMGGSLTGPTPDFLPAAMGSICTWISMSRR